MGWQFLTKTVANRQRHLPDVPGVGQQSVAGLRWLADVPEVRVKAAAFD